jgi:hypothetical protein
MDIKTARKQLKTIGYNVSVSKKQSPFSDKVVTFLSLVLPDKTKVLITGASVFTQDFFDKHGKAMEIFNQIEGY